MRGLLADVNVQGYMPYLRRFLETLDLWDVLSALNIEWAIFPDLQLPPELDDRSVWSRCQHEGWVLLTDNRNEDDETSLQATLKDSWRPGHLPVLTLANKARFETSAAYAQCVATDIAEVLFGIAHSEYRDQPRIYVPRSPIGR